MFGVTETQVINKNKKLLTILIALVGGYIGVKMFFPTLINVKKNPLGSLSKAKEKEIEKINKELEQIHETINKVEAKQPGQAKELRNKMNTLYKHLDKVLLSEE